MIEREQERETSFVPTEDDIRYIRLLDAPDVTLDPGDGTIACRLVDFIRSGERKPELLGSPQIGGLKEYLTRNYLPKDASYYYALQPAKSDGSHKEIDIICFSGIVIDVDDHVTEGYLSTLESAEVFLHQVSDYFQTKGFTAPNAVVNSGRGYQLLWRFSPLDPSRKPVYERVVSQFINLVQDYCEENNLGALEVDAPHSKLKQPLCRLPGCYKPSQKIWAHALVASDDRMDLEEEYKRCAPVDTKPKKASKKKARKKRQTTDNKRATSLAKICDNYAEESDRKVIALGNARIRALKQLGALRAWKLTGYRHYYLYIYIQSLCNSGFAADEIVSKTMDVNEQFSQPLDKGDVDQALIAGLQKAYYLSTETIFRTLKVSDEEKKELDLRTGVHYKRDEETANRRKARDKKVVRLYKNGMRKSEIAKRCGLCRDTVNKILQAAGFANRPYTRKTT